MKAFAFAFASAFAVASCASPAPDNRPAPGPGPAPAVAELSELHRAVRVAGLESRTFHPDAYWRAVSPVLSSSSSLRVEQVGESAEGRPLRLVTFGAGPTPVLLWSQMHGDEPTASMALADLFALFATRPDHPLVRTIRERLTVYALPVLNPDGAARFQRRNAQGVDINRDARVLATPEGRTLKAVRERVDPVFGFNLHDQDVRTRLADTDRGVAIALLAPPPDGSGTVDDVRMRAIRLSGLLRRAVEPLVDGRVARYDDTFNPRAFGDLMTAWGTSTILIESGGWDDDPEKQHLRMVNFVALLTALESIATGSYERVDPSLYRGLPENGRRVADLKIAGGTLVLPDLPPLRGDLLVEYGDAPRRTGGRIIDVGDLLEREARDTLDASGLYVIPAADALERGDAGTQIAVGAPARLVIARDPQGRDVIWRMDGGDAPQRARP